MPNNIDGFWLRVVVEDFVEACEGGMVGLFVERVRRDDRVVDDFFLETILNFWFPFIN